jgi:signal transduction histidine kinase
MNETLARVSEEYAAALAAYLAEPREASLMQAYELGRRSLALEVNPAELALAHGKVLAAALRNAGAAEKRVRSSLGEMAPHVLFLRDSGGAEKQALLAQRAAEFLGEAMAPLKMIIRGYREANALLQRLSGTLEQRVKERTADLTEAAHHKDQFLAMLAHELRNPLAPIRNALHILRLTSEAEEVELARDVLERQVQNLGRLIEDLMDLSRLTRGKIQLQKERLDLVTVVKSGIEISRPHIEEAGHDLTVMLPAAPVYLQGDAARLAQVMANLLNNATKYTEPGGRIWVTAERNGDRAVVRVRDTGIGIPPEMLPEIFSLFVQVPSSLERSQGGLGIGLTLVKNLVEMHGGTVAAHSAGPGQGSEFIVRLPVASE